MTSDRDPEAATQLESLRHLEVVVGGVRRKATLTPPRLVTIDALIAGPERRRQAEQAILCGELVQILELDGEPLWADEADAVIADGPVYDAILAARDRLYAWLVEQGRVRAICPRCGTAAELDLGFYVLGLRLPPWRVTDGRFMAVPGLAHPEPPPPPVLQPTQPRLVAMRGLAPRPATPPRAARVDFVLPSARIGLAGEQDAFEGTLGDISHVREAEAWQAWAPEGIKQPSERRHWNVIHASFRTALRLAVALTELRDQQGAAIAVSPESVEQLFLADIQFLDVLYTATHDLPVETVPGSEPRCTLHCTCGQAFLPVR